MKYKAGDTIEIKTWSQMEREFGKDGSGDINCKGLFMKRMEEILQENNTRILKITSLQKDSLRNDFYFCIFSNDGREFLGRSNESWYISDDMILELAKNKVKRKFEIEFDETI